MIVTQSRILAPILTRCHVVVVHDGDTFTISKPSWHPLVRDLPVRIAGIDAPELGDSRQSIREIAEAARDRLRELIEGKSVTLKNVRRDKYFRLIASVYAPHDVGGELELTGLARIYSGEGAKPW